MLSTSALRATRAPPCAKLNAIVYVPPSLCLLAIPFPNQPSFRLDGVTPEPGTLKLSVLVGRPTLALVSEVMHPLGC